MKKSINLLFLFVFLSVLSAGIFQKKIDYDKMDKSELINIINQQRKILTTMTNDYQKLYKDYSKYYDSYNSRRPILFRNIHFSLSAGIGAILKPDNLMKSNFDFLISGAFYYKYFKYSIMYQPINKNVILGIGIFW